MPLNVRNGGAMLPFEGFCVDLALGCGQNPAPTNPALLVAVMFTFWAKKIA